MFILKKDNIFKLVLFIYVMGRGYGFVFLVGGLILLYMGIENSGFPASLKFSDFLDLSHGIWPFVIGGIFIIIGLWKLLSIPKPPRY
jgi:hypothetical protein